MFALLTIGDAKPLLATQVTKALDPSVDTKDAAAFVATVKRLGGRSAAAKAELPREDWPMMVRFRDINDPVSVEEIDPSVVGVKRILLETTTDSVTTGVERSYLGFYASRAAILMVVPQLVVSRWASAESYSARRSGDG